jgi:hypothetical protein
VGAVWDEGSELWLFAADEPIPDFSPWDHLSGHLRVITFADPEVAYPDPPATWDFSLIEADREQLMTLQSTLRGALRAYRPLTFLRNDLVVTRDPLVVRTLEGQLGHPGS